MLSAQNFFIYFGIWGYWNLLPTLVYIINTYTSLGVSTYRNTRISVDMYMWATRGWRVSDFERTQWMFWLYLCTYIFTYHPVSSPFCDLFSSGSLQTCLLYWISLLLFFPPFLFIQIFTLTFSRVRNRVSPPISKSNYPN